MTDLQILTLAIAIVFPACAVLYSNSRINEAKETLRAEMALMKTEIVNEVQVLKAEIQALKTEVHSVLTEVRHAVEEVRMAIKVHELEHHK